MTSHCVPRTLDTSCRHGAPRMPQTPRASCNFDPLRTPPSCLFIHARTHTCVLSLSLSFFCFSFSSIYVLFSYDHLVVHQGDTRRASKLSTASIPTSSRPAYSLYVTLLSFCLSEQSSLSFFFIYLSKNRQQTFLRVKLHLFISLCKRRLLEL